MPCDASAAGADVVLALIVRRNGYKSFSWSGNTFMTKLLVYISIINKFYKQEHS